MIMSGHLNLMKAAFVPCESQPAAFDFGLFYVDSPFVNVDRWALSFMVMGKVSKKERCRRAVFFLYSFWYKIKELHERYTKDIKRIINSTEKFSGHGEKELRHGEV